MKENNCIICGNHDLDDGYANGIWNLAGEIANALNLYDGDEQDKIHSIIQNFLVSEPYCPRCGRDRRDYCD